MEYLGARKFHNWTCCRGSKLEFADFLSVTHSFTNVCKNSLHALMLDFVHLAIEVIWTLDFDYLDRGEKMFGNTVYFVISYVNMQDTVDIIFVILLDQILHKLVCDKTRFFTATGHEVQAFLFLCRWQGDGHSLNVSVLICLTFPRTLDLVMMETCPQRVPVGSSEAYHL